MSNTTLKFTFKDGSEALAHYGVKGMKWGNWNADTKAKYAADPSAMPAGGGGTVDDEYQKEKEYNSKKNEYPPTAGDSSKEAAKQSGDPKPQTPLDSIRNLLTNRNSKGEKRTVSRLEEAKFRAGSNLRKLRGTTTTKTKIQDPRPANNSQFSWGVTQQRLGNGRTRSWLVTNTNASGKRMVDDYMKRKPSDRKLHD